MQLIDNRRVTASEFLAKNLRENVALKVASSTFSIFAFEKIGELLNNRINTLQLLLPSVEHDASNFDLIGGEAERSLRNRLTQQAIAGMCYKWMKAHTTVRTLKAKTVGQCVFCADGVALQGGADFTAEGLGFVPSRIPLLISGTTENEAVNGITNWFNSLWNELGASSEANDDFINRLFSIASDKSPNSIYYQILYHIFEMLRGDLDEDKILKTKTGIKDYKIWSKLYKFQKDGVLGAIDKLEKYNGCIIADSVGLGKTFEALAIIKYYELRNNKVLVICPKKLRENWLIYRQNDRRNIFCDDRFSYDVLNHTDLNRKNGMSGDINLATVNWGNYDLVVIDESHNFRNNPPSRNGVSRYQRLMRDIIKSGVRTKVLMLSATPLNNRMADLKNQIAFITEDKDFALATSGINSIKETLRKAQNCFNRWLDIPDHSVDSLLRMMNLDYFKLLDLLTIARSRKHIQKYYDCGDICSFPDRRTPINIKVDIDASNESKLSEINETLRTLHLAAYAPLKYVMLDKLDVYAHKYDVELGQGRSFKQIDREANIIQLMRINLLKRMESSISSFKETIDKLLGVVNSFLEKLENYDENTSVEEVSINDIEIDDPSFEDLLIGNRVKVLIGDCDILRWKQDLNEDREKLGRLSSIASVVTPERDQKLVELKNMIYNKVQNPINDGNRKVIVFTAFVDTAEYLYANLSTWAKNELGIESALVTGSETNRTTFNGLRTDIHTLLTNFSPRSKERAIEESATKEIDLLIATDCISEGQNLQDCDWLINYDIHWNPVRIIQRFGRIDRIGSINKTIQLVNFWPNMELDAYIDLEARVSGRMVLMDITATGEENVIGEDVKRKQQQMNDLEYRKKQLRELQNAVLDLEDISGGISITDLTLNDFRMNLLEYMKEKQSVLEATPFGAHTVVALTQGSGEKPGAIFCLKDMSGREAPDSSFAFAPYYLVYVADDGSIVFDPSQMRDTLSFLKKMCDTYSEPSNVAIAAFNRATKNGTEMGHYQNLLGAAVASVAGRQQKDGVKSLFSRGGVRLVGGADRSVNDFEVVAFVAVMGK